MQMHCRELFTLDINGWGCENSSYKGFMPDQVDETDATAFCRLKSDHLIASGESKCDQPIETDMTPARFILVPTQTPRDYTLKHHSPITMRYFIESVQAWANETENHIVFKLHPHGRDMEPFIDTSEYVHKAEGNIHELIKRASGLFVINSGTGFEALIHGKPVCTFGSCDYNLVTHNGDVRRLDEARNFIYSYKEEWRKIGYQFVYWYWYKHAYDVNDVRAVDRLTEYLRGVL